MKTSVFLSVASLLTASISTAVLAEQPEQKSALNEVVVTAAL